VNPPSCLQRQTLLSIGQRDRILIGMGGVEGGGWGWGGGRWGGGGGSGGTVSGSLASVLSPLVSARLTRGIYFSDNLNGGREVRLGLLYIPVLQAGEGGGGGCLVVLLQGQPDRVLRVALSAFCMDCRLGGKRVKAGPPKALK
jgi:hypothetical protein